MLFLTTYSRGNAEIVCLLVYIIHNERCSTLYLLTMELTTRCLCYLKKKKNAIHQFKQFLGSAIQSYFDGPVFKFIW